MKPSSVLLVVLSLTLAHGSAIGNERNQSKQKHLRNSSEFQTSKTLTSESTTAQYAQENSRESQKIFRGTETQLNFNQRDSILAKSFSGKASLYDQNIATPNSLTPREELYISGQTVSSSQQSSSDTSISSLPQMNIKGNQYSHTGLNNYEFKPQNTDFHLNEQRFTEGDRSPLSLTGLITEQRFPLDEGPLYGQSHSEHQQHVSHKPVYSQVPSTKGEQRFLNPLQFGGRGHFYIERTEPKGYTSKDNQMQGLEIFSYDGQQFGHQNQFTNKEQANNGQEQVHPSGQQLNVKELFHPKGQQLGMPGQFYKDLQVRRQEYLHPQEHQLMPHEHFSSQSMQVSNQKGHPHEEKQLEQFPGQNVRDVQAMQFQQPMDQIHTNFERLLPVGQPQKYLEGKHTRNQYLNVAQPQIDFERQEQRSQHLNRQQPVGQPQIEFREQNLHRQQPVGQPQIKYREQHLNRQQHVGQPQIEFREQHLNRHHPQEQPQIDFGNQQMRNQHLNRQQPIGPPQSDFERQEQKSQYLNSQQPFGQPQVGFEDQYQKNQPLNRQQTFQIAEPLMETQYYPEEQLMERQRQNPSGTENLNGDLMNGRLMGTRQDTAVEGYQRSGQEWGHSEERQPITQQPKDLMHQDEKKSYIYSQMTNGKLPVEGQQYSEKQNSYVETTIANVGEMPATTEKSTKDDFSQQTQAAGNQSKVATSTSQDDSSPNSANSYKGSDILPASRSVSQSTFISGIHTLPVHPSLIYNIGELPSSHAVIIGRDSTQEGATVKQHLQTPHIQYLYSHPL